MTKSSIVWRVDSPSPLSGEEKSVIAEKMLEISDMVTEGAGTGEITMGERHMQVTITIRTTPSLLEEARRRAHDLAGRGWGKWFAKAALWIKGAPHRWDDFMRGMEERQMAVIKDSMLTEANRRLSDAINSAGISFFEKNKA